MAQKFETCIVRGVKTRSGIVMLISRMWKFVAETTVSDKTEIIYETEPAAILSPEMYEEFDALISRLTNDGWEVVGILKEADALCLEHSPKTIQFRRPVSGSHLDDPLTALHLLHEKGFVTAEEFVSISKRISDSK